MYLLSLIVLAPALGLLVWLLLARARRRKKALAASPTVLGQPTTVRPLNAGERAAYRILVEALPRGYLLLSQVALARFIKVEPWKFSLGLIFAFNAAFALAMWKLL